MKWPTSALRAASTSESCPSRSTALIESIPSEAIVVAPDTTVAMPSQARASDSGSRSSPRTTSAPSSSSHLTRSGSELSRTIARTGLSWPRSASQTAPPTLPVAPTTRFIGSLLLLARGEYHAGGTPLQARLARLVWPTVRAESFDFGPSLPIQI